MRHQRKRCVVDFPLLVAVDIESNAAKVFGPVHVGIDINHEVARAIETRSMFATVRFYSRAGDLLGIVVFAVKDEDAVILKTRISLGCVIDLPQTAYVN